MWPSPLCDLRMPELDGRAFYARLRQQAPALCQRVIFLTGDSSTADHQAFLAQCGRPWLDKPSSIAALRHAIQQVLKRATRAPAFPHLPGTPLAESGAVGQSADLAGAERTVTASGRAAARGGLER